MSSFSSDPWRRDDDQSDQGTPGGSGDSGAPPPQPTGWERPSSDPSGQPPSSASSASSASSQPSQSSAPDWPSYPPGTPPAPQPSGPEATRPFSAEQPPYQPYDPQSMPGYGGGTSAPYGSDPYSSNAYGSNSYGSNPYEANPYENQPAPYGAYQPYTAPAQHPQAVTAFVLGLLGLVICPPIGIGGLVMGGRVRREIDASGGQVGGRGLATAGWVLGILSVIYFVLAAIFITFAIIVSAGQS